METPSLKTLNLPNLYILLDILALRFDRKDCHLVLTRLRRKTRDFYHSNRPFFLRITNPRILYASYDTLIKINLPVQAKWLY